MKRLLLSIVILALHVAFCPLSAQNDDIEVADSTSTDWGDGGGGGFNPQTPTGPVTSLTLSPATLTLEGGEHARLTANVNSDAANKTVLWSSANSNIAAVSDNGQVYAWTKGTTTITAIAAGNNSLKQSCTVTVTSDYEGPRIPAKPFEFLFDAVRYDETSHSIENHPAANLQGASLQLSANLPTFVDNSLLRIASRCEGYIDKWPKGSTESGAYFYRHGDDCMTLVAKVAPRLNAGSCDFLTNRGSGYNYMWRIGDHNSSYLHTGTAYQQSRSLVLNSEEPQVLAVRVNGPENYILLENLTTDEKKRIDGVNWGGGNNVFKLFYNDSGEYFLGDFFWVYYSFSLLTDFEVNQMAGVIENVTTGIKTVERKSGGQGLYNLQGQRVTRIGHGVYIRNGKKFMISPLP